MAKTTINAEMIVVMLLGFLLTVMGIYLNFQNLAQAQDKYIDPNTLNNNEIMYGLIQIVGMAVIFIGAVRGLLKRSDVMANKFVNIMDVFTSLIKKEIEVIDDHERKKKLSEIELRGEKFKKELGSLRRL